MPAVVTFSPIAGRLAPTPHPTSNLERHQMHLSQVRGRRRWRDVQDGCGAAPSPRCGSPPPPPPRPATSVIHGARAFREVVRRGGGDRADGHGC
ncbi:putative MOSC domain-containing protein [Rosellinia necatrix]|uniref:Putative MOSC domain-containing protein n=1 Tax=Rosellinia necatrix TaxID=77044 RepID=A0A1S8A5F5_ROSNE|nr:putative MOSC domain-containing protein [Rosellinia necatrix]